MHKPHSGLNFCLAPAVALIAGALTAIACSEDRSPNDFDWRFASVVGTPDGRQIPARLKVAAVLTSRPGASGVLCTLPAGAVDVAKYESGYYRVYTKGRVPCAQGNAESFRGWVPATAVEIKDDAYFGKLVRVQPNSAIDVRMNYQGNRIFCTGGACKIKEALYGSNACYVHPKMAGLVQNAAITLRRQMPGAKLVMLDCYRPVYVQERMADLVRDPNWVAQPNPPRYGDHNGGIAIDVSVADASGALVDMGSGFDEFTARSNFAASGLTNEQRNARRTLRDAMTAVGLRPYDGEWWHFSLDTNAEPLDLAL